MGKDKESRGSSSALEELVNRRSDRTSKEKRDGKVQAGLREKSSKRERSREHSKSMKRHRKRSHEDHEEPKPQKPSGGQGSGVHRRRIRWVHDDKMFRTRYFRITDEPIADGLTEPQMREFREKLIREAASIASSHTSVRNVRAAYVQTESSGKNSAENIAWTKPRGMVENDLINSSATSTDVRCGRLIIKLDRICLTLGVWRGELDEHAQGKNSTEKKQQELRISTKIACYFAREYQIPDNPTLNQLNNDRGLTHKVHKINLQLFKEDETTTVEIEANPSAKLTYLTEQTRKQLGKRVAKTSIKKVEEESDKSDYSELGDIEIDQEDELLGLAQFVGMMGQSLSNYKSYIKSLSRRLFYLEKRIAQLDEAERDKVKRNIEIIVNVFDSNSKVLAVNSNKVIPDNTGMGGISSKKSNQGQSIDSIKMVNKNYKTKHCNKYHSDAGCGRGEACHFIHDIEYKGRPAPEPQKRSTKYQGGGYGGGMQSMSDKPRSSMGGYGDSMGQYSGMQSGYSGMPSAGMSGGYPHHMMGNGMGMRAMENAGGYSGMYKPGPNFSVTNLKPDKPGVNPVHPGMAMAGGQSVMRMVPPPAPPSAPPRR